MTFKIFSFFFFFFLTFLRPTLLTPPCLLFFLSFSQSKHKEDMPTTRPILLDELESEVPFFFLSFFFFFLCMCFLRYILLFCLIQLKVVFSLHAYFSFLF